MPILVPRSSACPQADGELKYNTTFALNNEWFAVALLSKEHDLDRLFTIKQTFLGSVVKRKGSQKESLKLAKFQGQ